ncbi:hypothetical protein SmJEL517_g03203 [Synchytrium microbalum]|uniref:Mitochondrial import receptor subunit TOM20 n=1 Tax=Synchytrium microbalum TaxID=1806994 RepID=A0A507BXE2_9FUNG|nr:uncharacterized protein SmJEL517_g03203 [Synchytrium microbalum]TPX33990.1 hypothetical protein SmJEL517_g03203 [Synchytrium microbalum]
MATEGWSWREYALGTTLAVAVASASYLVYFDYKRRNDVQFRKTLKRQKKALMKVQAEEEAARSRGRAATAGGSSDDADKIPTNVEEKEKYFMDQLQSGEILYRKGPAHYQAAAACFMRAMKVYPQPLELISLFQKSLPEPVFQILMEMMSADVREAESQQLKSETRGGRSASSSTSPTRPEGDRRRSSLSSAARARNEEIRATEAAVEELLQELMGDDGDEGEWEDEAQIEELE